MFSSLFLIFAVPGFLPVPNTFAFPSGPSELSARQSAANPNAVLPGWIIVGCFTDNNPSSRTLQKQTIVNPGMTPALCTTFCSNFTTPFNFAGVEFTDECFCDFNIQGTATKVNNTLCNFPCGGDDTFTCGGVGAITIYQNNNKDVGPIPSNKASVGNWSFTGCFTDAIGTNPHSLLERFNIPSGVTIESCTVQCAASGFGISGLEFGEECWCGNSFALPVANITAPLTDCSLSCEADHTELCGAANLLSVYTLSPPMTFPAKCSNGASVSDPTCCQLVPVMDSILSIFQGDICSEFGHQLLHLAFHDALGASPSLGGGGADGSILTFQATEGNYEPNIGLQNIISLLQSAGSGHNISDGDLVHFAAAIAMSTCPGAPQLEFHFGRPQATEPASNRTLLSPTDDVSTILTRFSELGFSAQEMVALLSAHSIAVNYATAPEAAGQGLDSTPTIFDTQIFIETLLVGTIGNASNPAVALSPVAGEVRLQSDFVISRDPRTACFWQELANNQTVMQTQFKSLMARLQLLGQITSLVNCTDIVPIPPSLPPNSRPHFPAGHGSGQIQQACTSQVFPDIATDVGPATSISPEQCIGSSPLCWPLLTSVSSTTTPTASVPSTTHTTSVNTVTTPTASGPSTAHTASVPSTTPTASSSNQCTTGSINCCNSTGEASNPTISALLGLLGIDASSITALVGVTCSPITVIGGGSSSCSEQSLCCTNNSFNGVVALGCTPININL